MEYDDYSYKETIYISSVNELAKKLKQHSNLAFLIAQKLIRVFPKLLTRNELTYFYEYIVKMCDNKDCYNNASVYIDENRYIMGKYYNKGSYFYIKEIL